MIKYFTAFITIFFLFSGSYAQQLKPGFDKQEFIELLKIGARTSADSNYYKKMPAPQHSVLIYQSPLVGFDNLWQLWHIKDSVAVISIRGTTKTAVSFLANLYAAMVAAKGTLELEKDFTFNYNLSDDPKAAVHAGFLVAMAYLSRDILPVIDSCYKTGIKDFIIAGHSQGGAISYLFTSYMDQMKKENRLAKEIRFKTYTAASPKPGNLFYAYQYEGLTREGWGYQVVNSVDWVPEAPPSVQTMNDFNYSNPFTDSKKLLKKQKFPINLVLLYAHNRMTKPVKKAQQRYQHWLGKRISSYITKSFKEFSPPPYFASANYVRTGTTIVLTPDSSYFQQFPVTKDSIWHNHTQVPYLFLMEKWVTNDNANMPVSATANLNGTWVLDHIAGQKTPIDSLFPQKKPFLIFNIEKNELTGNSGCNSLSGKLTVNGNKINISGPIAGTMMACPGGGEKIFLETLIWVNAFSVNGNSLTLIKDDVAEMQFHRL